MTLLLTRDWLWGSEGSSDIESERHSHEKSNTQWHRKSTKINFWNYGPCVPFCLHQSFKYRLALRFLLFSFRSPSLSLGSHQLNGRLNQISMIWLWRTLTAWNTLNCYWHKCTHSLTLSHTFFRLNATLLVPVCSFIFNAATSVCHIFCLCLFSNVVQGACQHAVFLLGWQQIRCIHSLFLKLLFT